MQVIKQDILETKTGIICHQVNCVGVMGAGLALYIRKKWPIVYRFYHEEPPLWGFAQIVEVQSHLYVASLAGQKQVGTNSRQTNYGALSNALCNLQTWNNRHLKTYQTYFPYKMGCGLSGGNWEVVSELIEFYFPDAIICKP